jgi:membrane-bound lytic murein transglycosylase F
VTIPVKWEFEDVYDGLIKHLVGQHSELDWLMVKAIIKQESAFNSKATSSAGARGLMQLMPKTDNWLDGEYDGYDVFGNIKDGVNYLIYLFGFWRTKGATESDLVQYVLASYNGGQGNILKAKQLAFEATGRTDWVTVSSFLADVTGNHAKETVDYVDRVLTYYWQYKRKGGSNATA